MISSQIDISQVAHVIQIAIAPVFLLAGLSSFLNVLTHRLGRITDRSRLLQSTLRKLQDPEHSTLISSELRRLITRITMINTSILFGTLSAILISLVIIVLFLGNYFGAHLSSVVSYLFIACISSLCLAFTLFLIEVSLATNAMRSGLTRVESKIYLPPIRGNEED